MTPISLKCALGVKYLYSMSGHRVLNNPNTHVYASTKFAVRAITDGLRNELNATGSHIRVNVRNSFLLTLSQTSPVFYGSAVKVFWKTLWEKEKLLVTSSFSFSHSVSCPFGELSTIFIKFKIVVCKLFEF